MREFHMQLNSFQQVQEFVRLAAEQPFEIRVGNDHQNINGKDLMALGVPAGKRIGELLQMLLDEVVEERLPNERDALLDAVREGLR